MLLKDMMQGLIYETLSGSDDIDVKELVYDSRRVSEGCVFVCISGALSDGHKYASDATDKGAGAIICEKEIEVRKGVTVIKTDNTRRALAYMSSAYFGHPQKSLRIIGVTGTKGKTTTAYMIRSILEASGIRTGLIGTIECIVGDRKTPSGNTTPESFRIHQLFREMVDEGLEAVVMEVSSQGFKLSRTDGIDFELGIFTNLAEDHIGANEHKDFAEYLGCKSMLFRQCGIGILNKDDEYMEAILKDHTCEVETFGFGEGADLRAEEPRLTNVSGTLGVEYELSGLMNLHVRVDIPGKFSVYNSLAAIAVCRHFEVPGDKILEALKTARVKGRVELVKVSDDFTLMIDYAHNAFGLESLLTTLREYNPVRLVCLFGCGGDRSKLRRFEMGEVSGKLSDLTVITSDNPRTEEPQAIIDDIKTGISKTTGKYVEICDRREAIEYVIRNGRPGDIIVLAGKGHEDYQEINGVKYDMDERDIIRDVLSKLEAEGR